MVKSVVKPVSVGYGCYQEIKNPTPQKFFFCRYYTIHQRNSQAPSLNTQNLHRSSQRKRPVKKPEFIFEKVLDFLSLLWYVVVVLTGGTTYEKHDKRAMARKHHTARGQQKKTKEVK